MRSHQIVAIAVVLVVGCAVKVFFFSAPVAEAKARAATLDILQMHRDYPAMKDLPAQDMKANPY